jgi:hypothetical protein
VSTGHVGHVEDSSDEDDHYPSEDEDGGVHAPLVPPVPPIPAPAPAPVPQGPLVQQRLRPAPPSAARDELRRDHPEQDRGHRRQDRGHRYQGGTGDGVPGAGRSQQAEEDRTGARPRRPHPRELHRDSPYHPHHDPPGTDPAYPGWTPGTPVRTTWPRPISRGRYVGGRSAGRTPYWQDREFTPGNPDSGAEAAAGIYGRSWAHRPVDYFDYGTPSPRVDPSTAATGTYADLHFRPYTGADSAAGVPDHHQPPDARDPYALRVGRKVPRPAGSRKAHDGSASGAEDAPRGQLGPRLLPPKRGRPKGKGRRGRPRVEDRTVSFPVGKGRIGRPFLRSDAARQRQRAKAWSNYLSEGNAGTRARVSTGGGGSG